MVLEKSFQVLQLCIKNPSISVKRENYQTLGYLLLFIAIL
jgi:hypothetical protein